MVKYSFIVPVYNVEKYLEKCLDSLVNQTYKDFEIIVINDGSKDNSEKILDFYKNKYSFIRVIKQKNQGLSVARNNGVKKAKGEYIIFVDSDDYVDKNMLEVIDSNIETLDILRFQMILEDEHEKIIDVYEEKAFKKCSGREALKHITKYHYVEPACCYVFNKKFYTVNKFSFKPGVYHEDFGLIPYVISKAKNVAAISTPLYHYIQRSGSIMNNSDYNKTIKKVYDMFEQYKDIKKLVKKERKDYLLSYLANCVIVKAKELKKNDQKTYIKILKKEKVYNDILTNTTLRKIKKIILLVNFDLYLKVMK